MNDIEKKFIPLKKTMLIRRFPPEENKGGIEIPELYQLRGWKATVLTNAHKVKGFSPGDIIVILKEFVILPFADRNLAMTDAEHVIGKIIILDNAEHLQPSNNFVIVKFLTEPIEQQNLVILAPKKNKQAKCGIVYSIGPECHEVILGVKVWFENEVMTYKEDEIQYKIVDENNILCMETTSIQ